MQTANQNIATSTRLTKSNLWKSRFLQFAKWWPMLLGPAAMFVVYIAHTGRQEQYVSKGPNEYIALMLLAAGFAAWKLGLKPKPSASTSFNILPQFYGCKPVDEVIRQRRTGKACCGKCYGRKPVEIYSVIKKVVRYLHSIIQARRR